MAKGPRVACPRCGAQKVDTRVVRERPNGQPFKRQMPLVRFLVFVPVISVMEMVSFKAMLVTLGVAGGTAGLANLHNRRGLVTSRAIEQHVCRSCGQEWRHPVGEPEPARFEPQQG